MYIIKCLDSGVDTSKILWLRCRSDAFRCRYEFLEIMWTLISVYKCKFQLSGIFEVVTLSIWRHLFRRRYRNVKNLMCILWYVVFQILPDFINCMYYYFSSIAFWYWKMNNKFCFHIVPGIDGSLHLIDTSMTIKYNQWKSRYIRKSVQQLFLRQDSY